MRALSLAPVLLATVLAILTPRVTHADEAADVAVIDALYARWREAVESADVPGHVAVLHSDVRMLPRDADAVVGAAN